ncbi:MAG: hypothetical protein O2963_00100 [Proteobacteria bacterium]|nr:hypothetical protein [Pseudomonadota bacterium]
MTVIELAIAGLTTHFNMIVYTILLIILSVVITAKTMNKAHNFLNDFVSKLLNSGLHEFKTTVKDLQESVKAFQDFLVDNKTTTFKELTKIKSDISGSNERISKLEGIASNK